MTLLTGDCVELLATLPENSVDACVCDPPYDLTAGKKGGSGEKSLNLNSPAGRARISTGFMGLGWDGTGVAFRKTTWAAVYRVLKPGAHLLAFGGTRTYHRMTVAIEDAGFEIRDSIVWITGTGFPKSLNVSKKMDDPVAAKRWEGWGTALKPAHEPIVLARKPLGDHRTVAENVEMRGTGALNIDASRIGYESEADKASATPQGACTAANSGAQPNVSGVERKAFERPAQIGRWPANVILSHSAACMLVDDGCADDCPVAELDRQSGVSRSPETYTRTVDSGNVNAYAPGIGEPAGQTSVNYGDTGGASRFFYVAKASRSERERGCEALPARMAGEVTGGRAEGSDGLNSPRAGAGRTSGAHNFHPTVKPVALMQYLVRLVTPPRVVGCPKCEGFDGETPSGVRSLSAMPAHDSGGGEKRQTNPDVLLKNMREPLDRSAKGEGVRDHHEGLPADLRAGSGLRHGAQDRGGEEARQASVTYGSGPSPERAQDGQPRREPRSDVQAATRPITQAAGETDPVPPLPRADQSLGACATCRTPLAERPGRVLDPFMGSGSTGLACQAEGFEFIGMELNAEYVEIARARLGLP